MLPAGTTAGSCTQAAPGFECCMYVMCWQAQHVQMVWCPGQHSSFCMLAVQARAGHLDEQRTPVLQPPSLLRGMVLSANQQAVLT
jgi:hypothetical protein